MGSEATARELLLYCHGFCAALDGHYRGEDTTLFPAIAAAHPELRPVLLSLEQDHSMIAHLLSGLFRYEERQLLTVLATLELAAAPRQVLGPI
ncbi:hemerythrin domain-containing protein [Streptomyces sp. NPDC127098]|uniref:hemerythrin domain-containing protein n=1 Tax=Streptomyces sp. NPDC127098 TaxID=3347137 RepID=UPI003652ECBA